MVNTVTAPLYPDIHKGWDPAIYTYQYLLSPAKGWADFGSLDIVVKTPYYMTQCNLDGFEKTAEGYTLHLEGLPDKELEFVLCYEQDPARPGSRGDRILLFAGAAAAVLIGGLVVRMGKRRKHNG